MGGSNISSTLTSQGINSNVVDDNKQSDEINKDPKNKKKEQQIINNDNMTKLVSINNNRPKIQ